MEQLAIRTEGRSALAPVVIESPTSHPRRSPSQDPTRDIYEIKAAQTVAERTAAIGLIERMYATRGYKADPLPAADTSTMRTFVAMDRRAVAGTLTVRLDSPQGLAADQLFPEEVGAFRAAGMGVCEFTKLAMDRQARSPRLLASLFHVAYLLAHRLHGCKYLLIEVNPRHVRYYEAMLGFAVVGASRHNARVDAPAVLLALDLEHAKRQIQQFGGSPSFTATERSAYPYFLASHEEARVMAHLADVDHDITRVLDAQADCENPLQRDVAKGRAQALCH